MKYSTKKDDEFNYWTVIDDMYYYIESSNHRHANCVCRCGAKQLVRIDQLINNRNKSCLKCSIYTKRKWHKTVGEFSRSHYNDIKSGAFCRSLEFSISQEYLWKLFLEQNKKCKISGVDITLSPNLVKSKADRENISASLDRINPNIGYIEGNIQWVHKWINIMKGALSDSDFIGICKVISEYNKEKKDNFEPSSMNGFMQRKSVYSNREGATTNN